MTRGAGGAGRNPGAALVALPTALVDHDLGAERLIGDPVWSRVVAVGTALGFGSNTRLAMTDLAVDPKIVEVIVVRHLQARRIGLVMTVLARESQILYVQRVRKAHCTETRR